MRGTYIRAAEDSDEGLGYPTRDGMLAFQIQTSVQRKYCVVKSLNTYQDLFTGGRLHRSLCFWQETKFSFPREAMR